MRNKQTRKVTLSYRYLMKLSNFSAPKHPKRFTRILEHTYRKMLNLTIWHEDEHRIQSWVLFTYFDIDKDKQTCTIKVNPDLVKVLNNLANWTRFNLAQFTKLHSDYSKTMFRLIKQYRTTGWLYLSQKQFKILLSIPKSYGSGKITQRVINPIMVELAPIIKNLSISPGRLGSRGKINGYYIRFAPETRKADDFSKGAYQDHQTMMRNIKFNSHLTKSQRADAKKWVQKNASLPGPDGHKAKNMPIGEFNKCLKEMSLDKLKMFYHLSKVDSGTDFSAYEQRKLKNFIKSHDKNWDGESYID